MLRGLTAWALLFAVMAGQGLAADTTCSSPNGDTCITNLVASGTVD